MLNYDGDDFQDIFCFTFAIESKINGQMKLTKLKRRGNRIPVTKENRYCIITL